MNAPQSSEKVKSCSKRHFYPSPPCTGMPNRREVLSPSVTRAERNSTITGLMAISTPFDLIYMLLELVYFERFVTNLGS